MSARKLSVNLLPPSEFELSFWGRFLKWAVTAGRYIIILTELIVILAFLSRFKLDEDLRNLNEQIQNQVNYLESEQPRLNSFLAVQKRIDLMDSIIKKRAVLGKAGDREEIDFTGMLNYLDDKKPTDMVVVQLAVVKGEVNMTAVTFSEADLGNMMISMSRDGIWESLDLTQIVADYKTGIKFTLLAKLKK